MKIIIEDVYKNRLERYGQKVRLTYLGLYVDDIFWYGPGSGIIILDIVDEDEKK